MIKVKSIASSISPDGVRLDTFECEFPRIILAELNKHRMLSNSVESSRAITVDSVAKKLEENPFIPKFTKKQKGMQGYGEIGEAEQDIATSVWLDAAWGAQYDAETLEHYGVHKQVCNRLTENFTYVKGIISGTEWDNFFNLRIHHTAEPHIQELAVKIYREMHSVDAYHINYDEWHLPYIKLERINGKITYLHPETEEVLDVDTARRLSLAMCAQVSYRNIDSSDEKVERVLSRLFPDGDPVHAVPAEHIATPIIPFEPHPLRTAGNMSVTHMDFLDREWSGNFRGWGQWRHVIPNSTCYNFTPEVFNKRLKEIEEMNDVNVTAS